MEVVGINNRRKLHIATVSIGLLLLAVVLVATGVQTGSSGAVAATEALTPALKIDMGPTLGDPSTGWIELGGEKVGEGGPAQIHRVRLQGLAAGQTYWYTVKAAAENQSATAGPYRFRTPSPWLSRWSFAAYGDTRSRPAMHRRVVAAMLEASPRLILCAGDLVAEGDLLDLWYQFFPVIGVFGPNLPLYPALGNHERNAALYYELLPIPSGGGDYGSEWYTFTYGNCQFFVLDSCRRIAEQTEWLEQQLSEARPTGVDWRIAMFHHHPAAVVPAAGRWGRRHSLLRA